MKPVYDVLSPLINGVQIACLSVGRTSFRKNLINIIIRTTNTCIIYNIEIVWIIVYKNCIMLTILVYTLKYLFSVTSSIMTLYKLQGQTHLSSGNYQKWMGINTDNKNICFISTKLDKMKSSTVHIIEKLHFIKDFDVLPYWSPNCLLFKYWMLTDVDMVYLDIHNIQTYNQGYILSHIKWGYVCL